MFPFQTVVKYPFAYPSDRSSALPLGILLLSLSTSLPREVAVSPCSTPLISILAPAHPHPTGPHAQPLFGHTALLTNPELHQAPAHRSPPPESPAPHCTCFMAISLCPLALPSPGSLPQRSSHVAVTSCSRLGLSNWPEDSRRKGLCCPAHW